MGGFVNSRDLMKEHTGLLGSVGKAVALPQVCCSSGQTKDMGGGQLLGLIHIE